MRRPSRWAMTFLLLVLVAPLAACSSGGFDPSDLTDFWDPKKKLPGDRRAVFPEGVPGITQGVPQEMYKGSAQERQRQEEQAAAEAAAKAEEEKQKAEAKAAARAARAKPQSKPKVARRAAPPADDSAEPSAPPPQQAAPSPFPAPLPSGSFSR